MRVLNLYVNEIIINELEDSAMMCSTIYNFQNATWVSTDKGERGKRIGPITLLDNLYENRHKVEKVSVNEFHPKELPIKTVRQRSTISLIDIWSVDPYTLFLVVFPKNFVEDVFSCKNRDNGQEIEFNRASSFEDRLFYFNIFGGNGVSYQLDFKIMIEQNPKKYLKALTSPETIEKKRSFYRYNTAIGVANASAEFLLKVADLAAKIYTRSPH